MQKYHNILNMINSIFNGHPAAHVMLFLAAGLFLLHWTLSSTCKLSMIALGFSMCVCVSVTPRLVYILCTLRGEHNIEKCNSKCRLVSLGVACLSLPNVPWVLKPENYPHTHLKRENCQQIFCPACGCSWRKKGGKNNPEKHSVSEAFKLFQGNSGATCFHYVCCLWCLSSHLGNYGMATAWHQLHA